MKPFKYQGPELDIFSLAANWKKYWAGLISPYIRGRVLEVGAGTGNNSHLLQSLCQGKFSSWTCLEPDRNLMDRLKQALTGEQSTATIRFVQGTIADLSATPGYDTVLYIDVLEHIADDAAELAAAADLLAENGQMIVLSPAHASLYSNFDREIGHFRRYTVRSLIRLTPEMLRPVLSRYIDSAGMLASLTNRMLLRQSLPTRKQIKIWDNLFIPVSRILDVVTCGKLGKSVLVVWRKMNV